MRNLGVIFEIAIACVVVCLILLAIFFHFGGMYSAVKWKKYVNSLEFSGVKCKPMRQTNGPHHSKSLYYICDNGEIVKWWERDWF